MIEFKFFVGYIDSPFMEIDWDLINRINDVNRITTYPTWTGTTYTPTWVVNPGLIQYTPPNYTITTTPGTGTYTIPYNGTVNTATSFSLTSSNGNGITHTNLGISTNTSNTFLSTTGTLTGYSSSSFK
jgi:hypothetical protein